MCTAKPGKTPITRRHTTAAAATRSYWSYPLWIPWGILLLAPNERFPKFATCLNVHFTTTSGNFFANLQRSSGGHIEALNRYLSSVILYSKIYPWYFMQVDTVDALIFHASRHSWCWKLIFLPDLFDIKTPEVYLHWFWWDESKKLNYLYDQPSHFYLWYFEMKMGLVPDILFFFALFSLFLCRYNNRLHVYSSGPNKSSLPNKY